MGSLLKLKQATAAASAFFWWLCSYEPAQIYPLSVITLARCWSFQWMKTLVTTQFSAIHRTKIVCLRFYDVEHAAAHDMMAYFSHMIARPVRRQWERVVSFQLPDRTDRNGATWHKIEFLMLLHHAASKLYTFLGRAYIALRRTAAAPMVSSWPVHGAWHRALQSFRAFAIAKHEGSHCDCQEIPLRRWSFISNSWGRPVASPPLPKKREFVWSFEGTSRLVEVEGQQNNFLRGATAVKGRMNMKESESLLFAIGE